MHHDGEADPRSSGDRGHGRSAFPPSPSLLFTDLRVWDQGLPCGAHQFMGRTVRPLTRLNIPKKATIREVCAIMGRAGSDHSVGGALGSPFLSHEPLVDCGAPEEPRCFLLSDVYLNLLMDDCESSTGLATLMRQSAMDIPCAAKALGEALSTWPVFKAYTPRCVDLMSKICNRARKMLEDGVLKISSVVGMSSDPQASAAAMGQKQVEVYGGHCFNVGRVFLEGGGVHCFLLEGTAAMDNMHVESLAKAIRLPVKVTSGPGGASAVQLMLFHDYLSLLGRTVTKLTQVINTPNGGRAMGGGVPSTDMQGLETRGWLSCTLFSPSLNSDREVPMGFYHRVVYTGMGKDADIRGCLPVEQDVQGDGSGFIAGCHPYSLSDVDLKGLDVHIPPDKFQLMRDIMNEAHPPLVDHSVLKRLSDMWGECSPLSSMNTTFPLRRLQGCEYVRVACMESPAVPEFCEPICRIKAEIADLANKINLERPDSDHAYLFCPRTQQGELKKEGTGCHLFIDVPVRACAPTIVHSLRSALKRLDFPGYVPVGDEM